VWGYEYPRKNNLRALNTSARSITESRVPGLAYQNLHQGFRAAGDSRRGGNEWEATGHHSNGESPDEAREAAALALICQTAVEGMGMMGKGG